MGGAPGRRVLLPGGRSRCVGLIAGVALRLDQPGEVVLNGLILCWAGGKAADVRHAMRGVDGGGLAALRQAAAGLTRCGGAQMRLWEADGWRGDSCGHAMAVALAHGAPIRQPAQGCPDCQRTHPWLPKACTACREPILQHSGAHAPAVGTPGLGPLSSLYRTSTSLCQTVLLGPCKGHMG